jgi:hypothetical protein
VSFTSALNFLSIHTERIERDTHHQVHNKDKTKTGRSVFYIQCALMQFTPHSDKLLNKTKSARFALFAAASFSFHLLHALSRISWYYFRGLSLLCGRVKSLQHLLWEKGNNKCANDVFIIGGHAVRIACQIIRPATGNLGRERLSGSRFFLGPNHSIF